MTNRRRGIVFALVLWILVAATALALSLALGARTQRNYAANVAASTEVSQVEAAALVYVLRGLSDSSGLLPSDTDLPCNGMQVGNGAFWIIRPDDESDTQWSYGLIDEGGRIDLNTAPVQVLQRLPNMTADVAAAIVDWRDPDDTVTEAGAESDYYLRKSDPYNAKNSPLESVLELRLVAGVTDEILLGEDTNQSGILDPNEDDGSESQPADNHDGKLDRGLAGCTTAFLKWPASQSGQQSGQSVNVNSASRQEIQQALSRAMTAERATQVVDTIMRSRPWTSIFHLYYAAGLTRSEFEALETSLTFTATQSFRLNLNTASLAAIQTLPGLTEGEAQAILQARSSATGQSLAWAIDVLPKEKLMPAFAAGVVGRSYQYSADIVALAGNGRAFRRCRYVIDVSGNTPQVIYRQDLSHCGWPLDESIRQRLRSGDALEDVLTDAAK